jgi:hypothetical protein
LKASRQRATPSAVQHRRAAAKVGLDGIDVDAVYTSSSTASSATS